MGFILQPRNDHFHGLQSGIDFKNTLNNLEITDSVLKNLSTRLINIYMSLPEDKQETTIPVLAFSMEKKDWNMMGVMVRIYSDKEPIHLHDIMKFDEFQVATNALEINKLFSN